VTEIDEGDMVNRPLETNSFEFIAIATLRTVQLMRGCVPRVPPGHKLTTTAQLEIIAGQVFKLPQPLPLPPEAPSAREGDT
jgi:hypothetical protein